MSASSNAHPTLTSDGETRNNNEGSPPATFHIVANAAQGPALSGGDRIFIECARRWQEVGDVSVYVWQEGREMCRRNNLTSVKFVDWSIGPMARLGFPMSYPIRILRGIFGSLSATLPKNQGSYYVYSASEFWPDLIPTFLMKLRRRNWTWIACFFLRAPSPFRDNVYRGSQRIRGLAYSFVQVMSMAIIRRFADFVWVTNDLDRSIFVDNERLPPERVIAVRGGVDSKTPLSIPEPKTKKFLAVFIGRFHAQKGVRELIDIWKMVCEERKDAKLAMIGVGDLEGEVLTRIKQYGLEKNIVLFGFKDGLEKLKIFKDSLIVVHPAIYDSGGMAACEAMACGLPGVSFDLLSLRSYYPKGMLKTQCFDLREFALNILRLSEEGDLYNRTKVEAMDLAREWDWDTRANELLRSLQGAAAN